jgi:hypothetical protein
MKRLIFPENSKKSQRKSPIKNLPLIFFILSLAFFLFSLYKGLFLPFALSTPPPSKEQSSEHQALQPFEQVVKDAQKLEGLFTLYRNQATNKVYLEIQPQQLDKKFLCFVTLASGLGEGGIFSGLPLGDFLFQLRRVQNNVQFVIPNIRVNFVFFAAQKHSSAKANSADRFRRFADERKARFTGGKSAFTDDFGHCLLDR